MGYVMLGVWIIQAAVGVSLLVTWARHGRRTAAAAVLAHVSFMVIGLALWVTYLATGGALWPWLAVTTLCVGIPFGEVMMVRRSRRIRGTRRPRLADYGAAIGTVFAGRMPPRVGFHALFSAAVFFGSLGVAIGATVAA